MEKKEKSIVIKKEEDGTTKMEFINCNVYDHELMGLLLTAADMYIKLKSKDSQQERK